MGSSLWSWIKKRRRSRNRAWPLSDFSANYIAATAETEDNLKMNCDLCSRRETRLKMAAKQIEWDTSKFLKDPSVGTKFWLEAAYRYLDEILSSHPEHRRRRIVAIPDERNA
jgi:hypothetical protein